MTRAHLSAADRSAMARAVFALRSRVIGAERGPTRTAIELVNNAATAIFAERDLDVATLVEGILRHRARHFGLGCDCPRSAADAAAKAWAGDEDEERRAA